MGDGEMSPPGGTNEMCEDSQFGTFGGQFYFKFFFDFFFGKKNIVFLCLKTKICFKELAAKKNIYFYAEVTLRFASTYRENYSKGGKKCPGTEIKI